MIADTEKEAEEEFPHRHLDEFCLAQTIHDRQLTLTESK